MKKFTIRKPTHRLIGSDEKCYADIRCGDWKPAIRLISTGETRRSTSALLDCDLLMGEWYNPLGYLFGYDVADEIPLNAILVRLALLEPA